MWSNHHFPFQLVIHGLYTDHVSVHWREATCILVHCFVLSWRRSASSLFRFFSVSRSFFNPWTALRRSVAPKSHQPTNAEWAQTINLGVGFTDDAFELIVKGIEFFLLGFDEVFLVCSSIRYWAGGEETFRDLTGNTKSLLLGSISRALSRERDRITHSNVSQWSKRGVRTDL